MSNNFVYRVMRNADSTEGRGPMVYVTTFKTFAVANTYIMHKGSPYGNPLKFTRNADGKKWSYEGWYEVYEDEVLQDYDIESVKADLKELKELEERAAVLRARTKL